jgi:hypothetical protein
MQFHPRQTPPQVKEQIYSADLMISNKINFVYKSCICGGDDSIMESQNKKWNIIVLIRLLYLDLCKSNLSLIYPNKNFNITIDILIFI